VISSLFADSHKTDVFQVEHPKISTGIDGEDMRYGKSGFYEIAVYKFTLYLLTYLLSAYKSYNRSETGHDRTKVAIG